MIKLLVWIGLMFVSALARADYPAIPEYSIGSAGGNLWNKDVFLICNNDNLPTGVVSRTVRGVAPSYFCDEKRTNGLLNPISVQTRYLMPQTCPYGGTLSGTVPRKCLGADIPPPDTNMCLDKNPFVRKWSYGIAVPPYQMPTSVAGCEIVVDEVLVCRKETIGGKTSTYCMMEVHRTGVPSDATETPSAPNSGDDVGSEDTSNPQTQMPPTSEPKGDCPAGSVQGGIDSSGTPICIGTGTNPPDTKQPQPKIETTNTETLPDGSTQTTTTQTTTNSDGSTTTNTTVVITRPDGTKETSGSTNTGTKPDGSQGVSDGTDEEKSDLCAQNPTLAVCRNSSVSGTCGEISCQGDAIQCATLRAAALMQCAQEADKKALLDSPLSALGNAALSGTDPLKDSLPTPAGASVIEMGGPVDASGWLGGGSCFPDKTITVQGHTITLPFSQACEILLVLRYALMVVAGLVSFRIVSGAVLT